MLTYFFQRFFWISVVIIFAGRRLVTKHNDQLRRGSLDNIPNILQETKNKDTELPWNHVSLELRLCISNNFGTT